MAGFIQLGPDQVWSSGNWVYWAIMDRLLENLSYEEKALLDRIEQGKAMQFLAFPDLREENERWEEVTLAALASVAQACSSGEMPCEVDGRVLDEHSQAQFREAATCGFSSASVTVRRESAPVRAFDRRQLSRGATNMAERRKPIARKPAPKKISAPKRSAPSNFDPASVDSFAALPEKTQLKLVGLVAPDGNSGGMSDGRGKVWTFSTALAAWRLIGGSVVEQRMILRREKLGQASVSSLMRKTGNLTIVAFTASKTPARKGRNSDARPTLSLLTCGSQVADPDLEAIRERLSQPVVRRDRTFGELTLNRQLEWFETTATHRGESLNIQFETADPDELGAMIEEAKPLWKRRNEWFANWRTHICATHLEPARSTQAEDEAPVTEQAFLKALGWPVGLLFWRQDGKFRFTLSGSCEGFFGDHGIDVQGDAVDRFDS